MCFYLNNAFTCSGVWHYGIVFKGSKESESPPAVLHLSSLLLFTCCLLCHCTAEDMMVIVHGFQLHGVHCVWQQGVDRAHHRVATKLSKDLWLWRALGCCRDLVGAGSNGAAPLHRHTLRCDREHRQSDVWRRERIKQWWGKRNSLYS